MSTSNIIHILRKELVHIFLLQLVPCVNNAFIVLNVLIFGSFTSLVKYIVAIITFISPNQVSQLESIVPCRIESFRALSHHAHLRMLGARAFLVAMFHSHRNSKLVFHYPHGEDELGIYLSHLHIQCFYGNSKVFSHVVHNSHQAGYCLFYGFISLIHNRARRADIPQWVLFPFECTHSTC